MDFTKIRFKGQFRDYQQRVLDGAETFLSDGKINIVAAPGSGKTVLGLELIKRLNQRAVILSPTTTIRNQWIERFNDWFLEDKQESSSYASYNLHNMKLITSITYQALHAAMNKLPLIEDGEEEDYSHLDLFKALKEKQIKTICLDEAHHLQNEWQKSLERFVAIVEKDVKIISLTATPPYDASPMEWERYQNVSGEIDDEIFVPQLVKEKTLCPHQDYIYFNYPTAEEIKVLSEYKASAINAIANISTLKSIDFLIDKINNHQIEEEILFKNIQEFIAILVFCEYIEKKVNKVIIKKLTTVKYLPKFNLKYGEIALQFIIKNEELFSIELALEIKEILKKNDLLYRGKVALDGNEKLQRALISSTGKLTSIKMIASSEYNNLKADLRMLILTDHIKKESIDDIGSASSFSSVNVVSIFETIRKEQLTDKIAILSGGLVIVNENVLKLISELTKNEQIKYQKQAIKDTAFYEIKFKADNKHKVAIIGELFEKGDINILIGTKALLGEGWDSPCINSVILASFIGSFVLSNQMRGRAIRVDKNYPNKSANIWHLATIEPDYIFEKNALIKAELRIFPNRTTMISNDFEILERRFNSFVGPNYDIDVIESGIERITLVAPPYNNTKFQQINSKMLILSNARSDLIDKWQRCVNHTTNLSVVNEVPKDRKVNPFTLVNVLPLIFLSLVETIFLSTMINAMIGAQNITLFIVMLLAALVVLFFLGRLANIVLPHLSPKTSILLVSKAILETLKEMDLIKYNTRVKVNADKENIFIETTLENASIYEQNIFNKCITELLSPIENPKYLIIKAGIKKHIYSISYACPEIIGKKKENAEILRRQLAKHIGSLKLVYVRNEAGRKILIKCRNSSYISINAKRLGIKKKSTKWN